MAGFTFRQHGLRFPRQELATSPDAAVRSARELGLDRVALKVVSPDILHKTDVGGVELDLAGDREIREGFDRVMRRVKALAPEARLDGVLVQEMVPPGVEAIIGLSRDPDFGPVLMFGLGGLLTELFRDVMFATLPVTEAHARRMVGSLRSRQLLEGYRGGPRVNPSMLVRLLVTVSEVGRTVADNLGSVDLNPVVLWSDDYRVVDEKVLFEQGSRTQCDEGPNAAHLAGFFSAKSVALVGASPVSGKIGYFIMDSLARHDYRGQVHPVNAHRDEVLGLKAWPSLSRIPDKVDLTVVATPLEGVPALVEECDAKDCRNMVVVSGGGKEIGGAGSDLEARIRETARRRQVRIVGCNCIGVFDGDSRLDTFFQTHERMVRPAPGSVAMITQSGTVGAMFLEAMEHIGVSRFASFGNRIDVDESDLLSYLAADSRTNVIAVYCEGFRSGFKFVNVAQQVTPAKPVVMFKAARTVEAARAAVSHTGFYGGSYEVARGCLIQAGVTVTDSVEGLVAASKALACLPAAGGGRVAMVSNGAGTTIQAVDLFPAHGLSLARLSDETVTELRSAYPEFYQVGSLVDVTGSATVYDYVVAIRDLVADPGVDIVMAWFVLQDAPLEDSLSQTLVELVRQSPKPIVCGAAGGPYTGKIRCELEIEQVPLLGSVEEWVTAAASLASRHQWRIT